MALLGFKPLPFEADPSLWVLFHDPQVRTYPQAASRQHVTAPAASLQPAARSTKPRTVQSVF